MTLDCDIKKVKIRRKIQSNIKEIVDNISQEKIRVEGYSVSIAQMIKRKFEEMF